MTPSCSLCGKPIESTTPRITGTAFKGYRHPDCGVFPHGPHQKSPPSGIAGPRVYRDDGHGCVERVHPSELAWEAAYRGGLYAEGPNGVEPE